MNFKSQYRKYSLIAIILTIGIVVFFELTPFMSGLLGALTIYLLLRGQMSYLTTKKGVRKGFAAALLLLETIIVFLIPLSIVIAVVVNIVGKINLNPQELIGPVQEFAELIQEKTGYDFLKSENMTYLLSRLTRIGQYMMSGISKLMINIFVLIFVLYFMLINKEKMERYIYEILPFSDENKKEVLHETNMIVKSNAIGIPLLAIIQGSIALIGYYIFSVPNPLPLGMLTSIATIIPMVGTGLVWFPTVIYLVLSGDWPNALGLAAYSVLIISQVDNLIRFMLQKKMANIHPLVTIFGVVIGLSLFGFMGIIFGPFLLSMLILCFNIFKKEYLD